MNEVEFLKLRKVLDDAELRLVERRAENEHLDKGIIGPIDLTNVDLNEAYRRRDEALDAYLAACGSVQFERKLLKPKSL